MEGLEAFLPRESVEAITYIKVIFTVTFWGGKDRERRGVLFFSFFFSEANYFRMCHSTLKIY